MVRKISETIALNLVSLETDDSDRVMDDDGVVHCDWLTGESDRPGDICNLMSVHSVLLKPYFKIKSTQLIIIWSF